MKDDKIVHIGRKKKPIEDELLEIAQLMSDDKHAEDREIHNKSIIYIDGSGNVVGNGNTVNNVINLNTPIKRQVQVKTGDGVLDATQKHQIKTILYEWVEMHNSIKKNPLTHQAAWMQHNNFMKVNSYHEIPINDFSRSIKYLKSKIGVLRNMASAPKKVENWRTQTIKSIQARCSEKGWQEWRKVYMSKKYNKLSMTELSDSELKQLYQAVWQKK